MRRFFERKSHPEMAPILHENVAYEVLWAFLSYIRAFLSDNVEEGHFLMNFLSYNSFSGSIFRGGLYAILKRNDEN